jgi:hypothetical protein
MAAAGTTAVGASVVAMDAWLGCVPGQCGERGIGDGGGSFERDRVRPVSPQAGSTEPAPLPMLRSTRSPHRNLERVMVGRVLALVRCHVAR